MASTLYCDTETFSTVSLTTCGSFRYAEEAKVLLWAYAIDDGPVMLWDVDNVPAMPAPLRAALDDESVTMVWANGDLFDNAVLTAAMQTPLPLHRMRDTKVLAYQHGLPGGLDALCEILRVPQEKAKLKTGRALINLFCIPDKKTGRRATRATNPEKWAEFCQYARMDIVSMREVYKRLPKWNDTERERELWRLDLAANYRGMAVDVELAKQAVEAIDEAKATLKQRTQELTDNEVQSATQRDKLLEYLCAEYLVDLPNLKADTVERRLNDPDLPEGLKELLRVRLMATTSSTAKYRTLLRSVCADGRLRGCMQFRGAARTGREAHRLFQPGNLPRPTMKAEVVASGVEDILAGAASVLHDNVMELTSNAIRGCIIAPPGRKLAVADWSAIEGRGLAFLAGEETELQAYRDFDAGVGIDAYKRAYGQAFGIAPDQVTKSQRQIGKVQVLMLGYEGGVGAWITGAATYGIDLAAMAEVTYPNLPRDLRDEAHEFYDWTTEQGRSTFGLPPKVFVTCDTLKRIWRRDHPNTVALWRDMKDAAIAAVNRPGTEFAAGEQIVFERKGNWLRMRLPSGRYLCYPAPKTDDGKLTYMGVNPYTKQWSRLGTYGGKLVENATQAICNDIMWEGAKAADAEGYLMVLNIHDELITEVPDTDDFSGERLAEIMCRPIPYHPGFPLAAVGFSTHRYYKAD